MWISWYSSRDWDYATDFYAGCGEWRICGYPDTAQEIRTARLIFMLDAVSVEYVDILI
jgi:hypothetical protein